MLKTVVAAISCAGVLACAVRAQAPVGTSSIVVYVSAPTRDGFVDTSKEIQDTVNDLRSRVRNDKTLALGDQAAGADVILTVIERGIGSSAFGERVDVYRNYYGGASLMALPVYANTRWISTVLQVGPYKREFSAASTNTSAMSLGAWGEDADRIIKDVRAWLSENDAAVRAKRVK